MELNKSTELPEAKTTNFPAPKNFNAEVTTDFFYWLSLDISDTLNKQTLVSHQKPYNLSFQYV